MRIQKLLTFLFALLLVTSITSCSKDDDGPSRRNLLTAGEWKGHSVYWGDREVTGDLQEFEESPYDITQFSYKFDKAGTYLVTYDSRISNGTWELVDNEQGLLMNKGTSFEVTLKIVKLTNNEFNYIEPYDESGQFDLEFRYIR